MVVERMNVNIEIKQKRRKRTTYSTWQLCALEAAFHRQQYIVGKKRIDLALSLGLNELQVKIWFQNRRIKWRRHQRETQFSQIFYNNLPINNNNQ